MKDILRTYPDPKTAATTFGNSVSQFASFFTAEANLSKDELEGLKRIVDEQLKDKKR